VSQYTPLALLMKGQSKEDFLEYNSRTKVQNMDDIVTKAEFEALYGRKLTHKELFECQQNLFGFFALLYKIQQRNLKEEAKASEESKI